MVSTDRRDTNIIAGRVWLPTSESQIGPFSRYETIYRTSNRNSNLAFKVI